MYSFSNVMPTKIYPNWDFWFENKLSGKPGGGTLVENVPHGNVRS
jgi:hypothetical protein